MIGSLYKILSKLLAGRLKRVLAGVISDCQNVFLPGRQILDGVAIANETLDIAKRKKKKCIVKKVDFEKAYNSVNWAFFDYMLHRLGFCPQWRRWMPGCYRASLVSVLINGSPSNEYSASRGLKQGDPLTPFLFLVVA